VEKKKNIAYGEGWEMQLIMALLSDHLVTAQKVHVRDCKTEGDVTAIIKGEVYAFELQVARDHNDRYSWTASKLQNFYPQPPAKAVAILGCPKRQSFCAIHMDKLRSILALGRDGSFSGVGYLSEHDFYVIDPEIAGRFAFATGTDIESLAKEILEKI